MAVARAGAPRRLTGERRREAILEAAKPVFGALGYHASTTREIAAAAEVSEALLYQHFPSKRDLFEAVILRAAADLENEICIAEERPDPLPAVLDAYFGFVEREQDLYRVFFRQALQADPAFEELYGQLAHRFLGICVDALGRGRTGPAVTGEAADLLAHSLVGMVSELALWWVEEPRQMARTEIVDRAARMGAAIFTSEVGNGA